ncbi:transmembrane protein 179 [Elysia marginata]|uniref:Transmembrane protein 179 n=1 Tax=Elysia marginata TaxID=1093978 RepID=A0AAV4E9K1_9GAST|nr:transmembrane protein 179 [Elysia marginata]
MTSFVLLTQKLLEFLYKMRAAVVRHLLILQVVFFVICLALSCMVFMPLALVYKGFRSQCLLFSDISLIWNSNKTVTVDVTHTLYGSEEDCNVPTFISVTVCVFCIIFSWFYLCGIFSANVDDETRPSTNKIQIPALLIFLALFISTIVAASKISAGFRVWCHNIVENAPQGPSKPLSCSDFEKLEWTNSINNFQFYTRFKIAEVSCWLLCVSLFILCCVTCVGCYQMLRAADDLMVSQTTLSVSLEETEDGSFVVVNAKRKQKENAPIKGSSQDYSSSIEDQIVSSDEHEPGQVGDNEVLVKTEATVHSEINQKDSSPRMKHGEGALSEVVLSDVSDGGGFLESEKVASGKINTSDGDEVPSSPSYDNEGYVLGSGDEHLIPSEKDALAKKASKNGGYGAVSPNR